MVNAPKQYASVILLTSDEKIILQLRDDIPGIVDPAMISLFAGAMLPGESPEETVRRETLEETSIKLGSLYFYKSYTYEDKISHVFIARKIDPRDVNVTEGVGYRLIKSKKELDENLVAPISKAILADYLSSKLLD